MHPFESVQDEENPMKEKVPFLKRKVSVQVILGGIALLVAAFLVVSMLLGPVVGNTFSTVNANLDSVGSESPMLLPPSEEEMQRAILLPASMDTLIAQQPAASQDQRLIIRNGNLSLTVDDALASQAAITKMVNDLAAEGAFVVSSSARTDYEGQAPSVDMVIRIPAAKFDDVMERASKLAVKVNDRTESAQDVTAEYRDLDTRLASLEAARDRLLQIMKQSATTEELLLAEQQLTQRETEIESIKGQMKYLSESARLSSITIMLYPYELSQPIDNTWRPAETIRQAAETFVDSLRGFADFLIVFVIAVLPWLVVVGLVWWVVARIVRKRRVRKQAETPKE
jgi:hypothetical protein